MISFNKEDSQLTAKFFTKNKKYKHKPNISQQKKEYNYQINYFFHYKDLPFLTIHFRYQQPPIRTLLIRLSRAF